MKRGFSLVESIIAIAIFVLLANVIYQTSALLIKSVGTYRENATISSLASQYMEIVHNLPYSSVGTVNGNPHGTLPDQPSTTTVNINGLDYQIYYVVNYIDNPADGTALAGTDFAPNDYKQVKLYVKNIKTEKTYSFLTNITPKGLENLDSGGALVIKVFDSVGQPVPNATINISNTNLATNINLTRTTDDQGNWIEVGLPDSANSYHIMASKNGYSGDQTYPISAGNPNPVKPDSTIANGQVTQISFSIDKLSSLSFDTLDQNCAVLNNIAMNISGTKLIGTPSLLKFNNNYTSNSAGKISLDSLEWDNYLPTITDPTKMIYGSSPIQQVSVSPDTEQNFTLLLGPKTTNSLLVIVKDAATNNPLEGARVHLEKTDPSFDETKITGGSVWINSSWSNLSDQEIFSVSGETLPSALRLLSYDDGATYTPNGTLASSVFDTGTASTTYTTLTWQPTSQDPETNIKFQIATANENLATTTWNFTGPDGTAESFYTTSGTSINSQSGRYVRYKAFLATSNPIKTPALTSLNINYVSGCFTPGQVIFTSLNSSPDYSVNVSADTYQTQTVSGLNITGNQTLEILLNQ